MIILRGGSSCRDLIPVDDTLIKKEAQKNCQGIFRKIELARKNITLYQTKSQPEFKKWFESAIRKDLTEMHQRSDELTELECLVQAVYEEAAMENCSPRTAYQRILKMKESGRQSVLHDFEEGFQDFFDEEPESNRKSQNEETHRENREREHHSHDFSPPPPQPKIHPDLEARLRELYRKLARKLHPDLNTDLDSRKTELWYEVQSAYEAKELERLETLFALGEMFDDSLDRVDGVSTLMNLFDELKFTLKDLDRQLRLARKDIAWRFHEKVEKPELLSQLKSKLQRDIFAMRAKIEERTDELNSLIAEWASTRRAGSEHQRFERGRVQSRYRSR